jgi:putative transposase
MRALIDPKNKKLTIEEQCDVLRLARSSFYYKHVPEKEDNLRLMKRIEEIHYANQEYGYRKVFEILRRDGWLIGEKKVERLWKILGYRSNLPPPNLSKPSAFAEKYPYLLNGMWILRPKQVYSTDITFLPLPGGFVYLATVVDWYSRATLSWEISNTLSVDFCIAALEKAFEMGVPEYFNTDQGSQFTSEAFVRLLKNKGVQISLDGRGRAIDNIYQERSWWSLKYSHFLKNFLTH